MSKTKVFYLLCVTFLVVTVLVVLLCISRLTKIDVAVKDGTEDKLEQYVNEFIATVFDEPVQIREKEKLHYKGGETALLYHLSPEGYILIEPNECKVIEFSMSAAYSYRENEISELPGNKL